MLKADLVPWDVVIDHKPAELQVYALTGGLSGDEDLGGIAEFAFGAKAGPGYFTGADFHAAMDLGDGQALIDQFTKASAFFSVTGHEIKRVLMLGEERELHLSDSRQVFLGFECAVPSDEVLEGSEDDLDRLRKHRSPNDFARL